MSRTAHIGRRALHALLVALGALGLTLCFFLVLPLFQTLAKPPLADTLLHSVATADLPPPPPPTPEEPEQEPEREPPPPELSEAPPPLDLSELELALDLGAEGDGWSTGDLTARLTRLVNTDGGPDGLEDLLDLADLDQKPRVLYQPSPSVDPTLRKRAPGTVHVVFVVDQRGRVEEPVVQRSTDPAFERPALSAVKQWKFEPGKRKGQAVRFRMRVPITFPKG